MPIKNEQIEIDFDDMQILDFALRDLEEAYGEDVKALLFPIRDILQQGTDLRFTKTKRSPDGDFWDKLSDGYLKQKRRQGFKVPNINVRTGKLKRSVKYKVQDRRIVVSARVAYAQYVQNRRKFIGISKIDAKRIDDRVFKFFERLFEKYD